MTKHELSTGVQRGRQDDDGQAYLAYFDPESQLGFCWNGHPESPIEVTHGGMGEAVIAEIPPQRIATNSNVLVILSDFQRACDNYIEETYE